MAKRGAGGRGTTACTPDLFMLLLLLPQLTHRRGRGQQTPPLREGKGERERDSERSRQLLCAVSQATWLTQSRVGATFYLKARECTQQGGGGSCRCHSSSWSRSRSSSWRGAAGSARRPLWCRWNAALPCSHLTLISLAVLIEKNVGICHGQLPLQLQLI